MLCVCRAMLCVCCACCVYCCDGLKMVLMKRLILIYSLKSIFLATSGAEQRLIGVVGGQVILNRDHLHFLGATTRTVSTAEIPGIAIPGAYLVDMCCVQGIVFIGKRITQRFHATWIRRKRRMQEVVEAREKTNVKRDSAKSNTIGMMRVVVTT